MESGSVPPVDPVGGGVEHVGQSVERPVRVDTFGFVEPVDSLGQGVVIRITDRPVRRCDPGQGELFGVVNSRVLATMV